MAKIAPHASILPATDDGVFKSLLTQDSPASAIVLADLISSIIGYKVEKVAIRGNEPAITDISIAALPRTFQITFSAYTVFAKQKSYVHRFTFKDEEGDELSDAVTIIIIELSKLKEVLSKAVEGMTDLEKWSIFIGYADSEEQRDLINQIIEKKEEVSMASELLQNISKDEHERARFRSRRMFENDLESNMNTAFSEGQRVGEERGIKLGEERGIKLGEERGEERKAKQIALEMKKEGVNPELIARLTGLSNAEVESLKDDAGE